jgi:signal transduction histidine kinase
MYVVTVLVGGVRGEYIPQPAVLAIALGALLARWRPGLGWTMAIIGMALTATLLFILAEAALYPDGVPTLDQPGGDLSRLGEFRGAFGLHLVAILLAIGLATILASKVTHRRTVFAIGLILMLATAIAGTVTLVTGDWMTYERLLTLPVAPWAFGWPVYALLLSAGIWWTAGLVAHVRDRAAAVAREDRPPVIMGTLLAELVPGFAGAERGGAEAERTWFATELHATVLPAIRSAVQSTGSSDIEQPEMRARLTELEAELRRIADGKRSVLLEEFGLVATLEGLVERMQNDYGTPIELSVDGDRDLGRPPRRIEQAALEICRLGLDNAVKHAGAAHILVAVGTSRDHVRLEISDDGRGVDPDEIEAAKRAGRHGVSDMQQAARAVAGHLIIEPTPTGTRVDFEWP